jgi:hypothetical protein
LELIGAYMSKLIQLPKNQFVIVDDDDFEKLNKYKWWIKGHDNNSRLYVIRTIKINRKRKHIKMHREIMGFPEKKSIDHIDHNGLNNQKSNLRICTFENNYNARKLTIGSSKYKGVNKREKYIAFRARIRFNKKLIHLGYFKKEIEAAKAYNEAAKKYFGEYACLNKING